MLLSSKIKYVGAKHLVTGVDSFLWCSNTKTKVSARPSANALHVAFLLHIGTSVPIVIWYELAV